MPNLTHHSPRNSSRGCKLPPTLRPTERIKPLISIPNKRQTERGLVARGGEIRLRLRPQLRRVVDLRDLVDGEVLRVDVGLQFGLEGGADFAQPVPLHAVEEGVGFEFRGAVHAADAVLVVADEAGMVLVGW